MILGEMEGSSFFAMTQHSQQLAREREADLAEIAAIRQKLTLSDDCDDTELLKLLALKALAKAYFKSLHQVVPVTMKLVEFILTPKGEPAFAQEQIIAVSEEQMRRAKGEVPLIVVSILAIRQLSQQAGMAFSSVIGQILWQHRRNKALRNQAFQPALEDFSWAIAETHERHASRNCMGPLERIFALGAAGQKQGRMTLLKWRDVVSILRRNPLLRPLMENSMPDQLFASILMQSKGESGIACKDFKKLIMLLAGAIRVSPVVLIVAIESYVETLSKRPDLEAKGRLNEDPLALNATKRAMMHRNRSSVL